MYTRTTKSGRSRLSTVSLVRTCCRHARRVWRAPSRQRVRRNRTRSGGGRRSPGNGRRSRTKTGPSDLCDRMSNHVFVESFRFQPNLGRFTANVWRERFFALRYSRTANTLCFFQVDSRKNSPTIIVGTPKPIYSVVERNKKFNFVKKYSDPSRLL